MLVKYMTALERHGKKDKLYTLEQASDVLKVVDLVARLDHKFGFGSARTCMLVCSMKIELVMPVQTNML